MKFLSFFRRQPEKQQKPPLVTVVTPNWPDDELLTAFPGGRKPAVIFDPDNMQIALDYCSPGEPVRGIFIETPITLGDLRTILEKKVAPMFIVLSFQPENKKLQKIHLESMKKYLHFCLEYHAEKTCVSSRSDLHK